MCHRPLWMLKREPVRAFGEMHVRVLLDSSMYSAAYSRGTCRYSCPVFALLRMTPHVAGQPS